jgi:hypothetical protein
MVLAIFKDRKLTSWTPQNQVMKEIEEKTLHLSDLDKCHFACLDLKGDEAIKSYLIKGNVEFSDSDVKDHENRLYRLKFKNREISEVDLMIRKEVIDIETVKMERIDCDCP